MKMKTKTKRGKQRRECGRASERMIHCKKERGRARTFAWPCFFVVVKLLHVCLFIIGIVSVVFCNIYSIYSEGEREEKNRKIILMLIIVISTKKFANCKLIESRAFFVVRLYLEASSLSLYEHTTPLTSTKQAYICLVSSILSRLLLQQSAQQRQQQQKQNKKLYYNTYMYVQCSCIHIIERRE